MFNFANNTINLKKKTWYGIQKGVLNITLLHGNSSNPTPSSTQNSRKSQKLKNENLHEILLENRHEDQTVAHKQKHHPVCLPIIISSHPEKICNFSIFLKKTWRVLKFLIFNAELAIQFLYIYIGE